MKNSALFVNSHFVITLVAPCNQKALNMKAIFTVMNIEWEC